MKKDKVVEAVIDEEKTYFFPRFLAYIIDLLIVFIICIGIAVIIPENKNHEKFVNEYSKIQGDYMSSEISLDEYINKSKDVIYDIDYTNVLSTLSQVVVLILYYVGFQYYNKGQTVGKKIMKIRTISTNGKGLTINQLAIRSIIINSIMIKLLLVIGVLFAGRNNYYYLSMGLQIFDYAIIIMALIFVLFRRDGKGLHDLVCETKVVNAK